MKISFACLALASANPTDERHFSDKEDFMTDSVWWWQESSPNAFFDKTVRARKLVFDHYWPGNENQGTRSHFAIMLGRLEGKMKKSVNKCLSLTGTPNEITDEHEVTRRSAAGGNGDDRSMFKGELDGRYNKDLFTLFWAYGVWIREAILNNESCDMPDRNSFAMRMLRRVDRMRMVVNWRYCQEILTPEEAKNDKENDGFCYWIRYYSFGKNLGQKRPHPRKWKDLKKGGKYAHDA